MHLAQGILDGERDTSPPAWLAFRKACTELLTNAPSCIADSLLQLRISRRRIEVYIAIRHPYRERNQVNGRHSCCLCHRYRRAVGLHDKVGVIRKCDIRTQGNAKPEARQPKSKRKRQWLFTHFRSSLSPPDPLIALILLYFRATF